MLLIYNMIIEYESSRKNMKEDIRIPYGLLKIPAIQVVAGIFYVSRWSYHGNCIGAIYYGRQTKDERMKVTAGMYYC